MSIIYQIITIVALLVTGLAIDDNPEVGYRVDKVSRYKKLREYKKSALYEIQTKKLDDDRPIKLLDLHGTHYQVGYAYAKLMTKEIEYSYQTFFRSALKTQWERRIIQLFLDWQYDSYVVKQIPLQFIEEIKGLAKGGKQQGNSMLKRYVERVLVISSFPGAIENDILSILADEFIKTVLRVKSERVQNAIQSTYQRIQQIIKRFIKASGVHCSFFAIWGQRTINSKLYSMRNLDWLANTGVNKNKLITVWNVDGSIPHMTLGFPGVWGALTGMSKAGLTVHEAGLSSRRSSEVGFQWTLRMRYIMMNARTLDEATRIWSSTKNALGMNFMITSGRDNIEGKYPAIVMETMRGYTAYFYEHDKREDGTQFVDPKTKEKYRAGFAMPSALFRTNHAYDSIIRKHMKFPQISQHDNSMVRYFLIKDGFKWYEHNQMQMGQSEALNMTAILGDKGSDKFLSCHENYRGKNVISAMFDPQELIVWVGFEYGGNQSFRSACCGVYVQIDMKRWF